MYESAENSIRQGSRSFAVAGMFFPEAQWAAATQIYHWCRFCDDKIDEDGSERILNYLRKETHEVLLNDKESEHPPFRSLRYVMKKFNIPPVYPEELLKGMEMDIKGFTYSTIQELELYCYRVASTVGLMMCYIMGIFHINALPYAAHLGIAMQLTNIARDIQEDFNNGRIYLPLQWLIEADVDPVNPTADKNKLFNVVQRVLTHADGYYESGMKGLRYLPLRSAFVICMSALFYQEIGKKVRSMGPGSLEKRAVVSDMKKIFLIMKAFMLVIMSVPQRVFKRRDIVKIDSIWSPA